MGVGIKFSSSGDPLTPGNPDPNNWRVVRHKQAGKYLVVEVIYPDARNFEGKKIMVYVSTIESLMVRKFLDPHFCDEEMSPIARFVPTQDGWAMACLFVNSMLSVRAYNETMLERRRK